MGDLEDLGCTWGPGVVGETSKTWKTLATYRYVHTHSSWGSREESKWCPKVSQVLEVSPRPARRGGLAASNVSMCSPQRRTGIIHTHPFCIYRPRDPVRVRAVA